MSGGNYTKEHSQLDRKDRSSTELRPISYQLDFQMHPAGSVMIRWGQTRVLCSVTTLNRVPKWILEQKLEGGWLTAEYRMMPGATADRSPRESGGGGPGGRSQEIQRLIGRSLRAVVDLEKIGQRTVCVDCDVIDADGGTRCAAITGSSVALSLAFERMFQEGALSAWPMKDHVAAVSAGVVDGEMLLDLCYEEDAGADVDINIVMTSSNRYVEVQGTAEGEPFSQEQLDEMTSAAREAIPSIFEGQSQALRNR